MPVPLDEFPIHQVPLSLEHVGSSDRNFYDRSYFNAHNRTDELFFVTGFGVYPNLGVQDAYALLRRGDRQFSVRFSDVLSDDRMNQRVGAYRIDVLVSSTTQCRRLVSSSYCLTKSRSLRASTFQSTCRSESPVWYGLCSANSTEKP